MSLREAAVNDDNSVLDNLRFPGLDYSQQDLYVDSEGRKANYPHYYKKSEEKLAKHQKKLSKMQMGSNNYNKELKKIQNLHKKIANQRKDFLWKQAAQLSSENDVIVVEDIDLRTMGQALTLGKNLHDNGFGMFRTMLQQKLEAKGSVLVKIDRFFPSSKTCHCCGYVNSEVVLGVSEWTCPVCGAHHDRDENAAIVIRDEGKHIFLQFYRNWIEADQQSRNKAAALSAARKSKKGSKTKDSDTKVYPMSRTFSF